MKGGRPVPEAYYKGPVETLVPADARYLKAGNPKKLYAVLDRLWCAETCAPRMRKDWSAGNKTLGQCSVTAFLAQDIYGGRVYGIPLEDGNVHCYNVVGDCVFDLTCEQFGDIKLNYDDNPEQDRNTHFAKEEKRVRYEMLKSRLMEALQNMSDQM